MVGPASIAKVTDFKFHILVQLATTLVGSLLLYLLLHSLRVEHLLVEIQLLASSVAGLGSLTLFELLAIEDELFHLLFALLHLSEVKFVAMRDVHARLLEVDLLLEQGLPLLVVQVLILKGFGAHVGTRDAES